jgi:hypothetical protein
MADIEEYGDYISYESVIAEEKIKEMLDAL